MNAYDVIRRPVITEKATDMKESDHTLCLEVDRRATVLDIRRAVETVFKVKVADVRVLNVRGKKKRMGRFVGRRSDWKKAIVTLKEGQTIEYYEGA